MKNWIWFGTAGHFICADKCQFHMCTQVGKYLVSTVGEYYLREGIMEEIGCNRMYETMVFEAGKTCARKDCDCGLPEISGSELDFSAYNRRGDAAKGHIAMCKKWGRKK